MAKTIAQKIFAEHLVYGEIKTGNSIGVKVDQVLTQDATGTMAYLQFESLGVDKIQIPLAVSYIDHNMLQSTFRNADDHAYLRTTAEKYGVYFSRPGNGICHQVNLERFAKPSGILLGSDSHTPTGGGMGMLSIGVGGLDIAATLAGEPYELKVPKIIQIYLEGNLQRPWITAMDIILEVLRKLTVKGGVGKIVEYGGPGIKSLTLTERATITNMGAELGATTSIFPSDEITLKYLKAQSRENVWKELKADEDAVYDEKVVINLDTLEPLVAQPHSPDNVVKIKDIAGLKVSQVCIGSCTNSSYQVLNTVGKILKGRTVNPDLDLTITPGSKQVFEMISQNETLSSMISSGARVLESGCGPCIGMGQAPCNEGVSVRSFNRNFKGRSGTTNARVYLVSPLSCAVIAIKGEIIDPREFGIEISYESESEKFLVNDNLIIPPLEENERKKVEIIRGPNIKEVPIKEPLKDDIVAKVILKTGDNITTDDIMPAGTEVLPLRSNIPAISEYVFYHLDPTFAKRAKDLGKSIIVGGDNYGQGSSREHAALAPMYLGIQAVLVKSFARIHRANLINFGILPLTFVNADNYNNLDQQDELEIKNIKDILKQAKEETLNLTVKNNTKNKEYQTTTLLTKKERDLLLAGGFLSYIKAKRRQ